jgi:hypothetical protein
VAAETTAGLTVSVANSIAYASYRCQARWPVESLRVLPCRRWVVSTMKKELARIGTLSMHDLGRGLGGRVTSVLHPGPDVMDSAPGKLDLDEADGSS